MFNFAVPYNDCNWRIAMAIISIFSSVTCDLIDNRRSIVFHTSSFATLESIKAAYDGVVVQ